ncbi:MAG: TonB-dependent receptor plug domain-containing protein, partial [Saprospiraceae bacterium]|nr:TonB-dependent receptor plug domain-containing protein [Saprospiraceae bacterium]
MIRYMLLIITALGISAAYGQTAQITGTVQSNNGEALPFANISLQGTPIGLSTDEQGTFTFSDLSPGSYTVVASYLGYNRSIQTIEITEGQNVLMQFTLEENPNSFDEVVITGTLKEVNRLESPVPVEVYRPAFFKKNPTPNIYEALQNVNGVRPQLNCNVCNTGDIHINGLEGPYTMVLIDGMPIVSSLATVYGLSGIPNNMIERMEIVKGPASSLYGSEAIGGLINIITKKPDNASLLTVDLMGTSWQEFNTDLGLRINLNPSTSILTGVNYFNYNNPIDNNSDHFTDVTLQERVSVFQKWNFQRKHNRLFTLAARYYWEDRWGGEMNWTPTDRGGSEIYGEAITTERTEWLGQYQLPTKDNVLFSFSFNTHNQNSVYGDMPYIGNQRIGFGQITWDITYRSHDLLLGSALRYTWYDDNTSATAIEATDFINNPEKTWLPGIFVQDEIKVAQKHTLILGLR